MQTITATPTYPFGGDVENNNKFDQSELLELEPATTYNYPTPNHPTPTPGQQKKFFGAVMCVVNYLPMRIILKFTLQNYMLKRLPVVHQVDEPTYKQWIVGKIERFDERNTCFNRALWDGPYQTKLQPGDRQSSER